MTESIARSTWKCYRKQRQTQEVMLTKRNTLGEVDNKRILGENAMIELLEHNVETYKNLCEEMKKHNKVALIQATGTGKTYIISKYIEDHCHNALILVPTNAIGNQWQKLLPNAELKTYHAMAKGIEDEYDLIVADEMHHLGSDVWGQRFIEYFLRNTEQKVIGATATEVRYLDNARDMAEEILTAWLSEV